MLEPSRGKALGLINSITDGEQETLKEAENIAYTIAAKRTAAIEVAVTQFRALQQQTPSGDTTAYESDWMQLLSRL